MVEKILEGKASRPEGRKSAFHSAEALDVVEGQTLGFRRRSLLVSLALGVVFPVANIVVDLASGRAPLWVGDLSTLGILAAFFLWVRLRPFSSTMSKVTIACLLLAFASSLFLPRAHDGHLVLLFSFTPIAYFLLGARGGLVSCLIFALTAGLVEAGSQTGLISISAGPYEISEILMGSMAFVFQNVLALVSEARHRRNLLLLLERNYLDDLTRLPNARALAFVELEAGEALLVASVANFRDLSSLAVFDSGSERLSVTMAEAFEAWCEANPAATRGPYRLGEADFGFILAAGSGVEKAANSLLDRLAGLDAIPRTSLRFLVRLASWTVLGPGPAAAALDAAYVVLADCSAMERISLHRRESEHREFRGDLNRLAPAVLRNIEGRLFSPLFQPVYDRIRDGVGFYEALLRFDVEGGLVSPEPYIETAIRLGLDRHLTDFILGSSLDLVIASGHAVSFNVTSSDLEHPSFHRALAAAYARLQGGEATLIVELTEHAAFVDFAGVSTFVREVHEAGGLVLLDDFGSGYSNYTSLLELHVDGAKATGRIVKEIVARPEAAALYRGMTAFCEAAGLEVVAEHISDETIMGRAVEGGARFLQGFWLSRPVSGDFVRKGEVVFPAGFSARPAPMRARV